jgi:ABC-2 type transport system permease protein
VNETEKGTIIRLRMAPIHSAELLTGISVVQIILGIISAFLSLAMAAAMGFHIQGSFWLILLIFILTSISIIAFSLILASFSKSANHILIVGNFPFFIFMFLSGAMFPLNTGSWFTIGGYSFAVNSLLSPVHAVSALNKVVFMQMGFMNIQPEIITLIVLILIYFSLGVWAFQYRHLRRR